MNRKILFVDDEPNVLAGYQRSLRKSFDIQTAEGGEKGIDALESDTEFAVIISDMRMPGMNGIQFLSRAQEIAPDSVRIMLTGDYEQQTAIKAVNEGKIFRFLTKPCTPEALEQTITAGLEQHRLITAEKVLLEETLSKSLQVLMDILAIINPMAFSRSARVKRLAVEIAARLKMKNIWELEIASMLSQIGCISVPEEILRKVSDGTPVSATELQLYYQHSQVGQDLIKRIPRMETIAWIIANQNRRLGDECCQLSLVPPERVSPITSTRILKLVLDFEMLLDCGNSPQEAFVEIYERQGWYDPTIVETLKEIIDEQIEDHIMATISLPELKSGMIVDEALNSNNGETLLEPGQEINLSVMLMLDKLSEAHVIPDKIRVKVPLRRSRQEMFSSFAINP